MKILLDYDPATNQILNKNGEMLTCWSGLEDHEYKEKKGIDELVTLKNAGFTVDEIIELRRKELI